MTEQPGSPEVCLSTIREQVGAALAAFTAEHRAAMVAVSEDVAPLVDHVLAFTGGGKRLRAAFAYVGHLGAGAEAGPRIATAAAALELLQACALIHDDIMDGSDLRRGLPSAHRAFESLHTSAGWSGDAGAFGVGAAILAGDLCLSWADEMLMASGFDSARLSQGKAVYDVMRAELMAGQYLDLVEQARGAGDVARARTVMRYKTAKYTIERPLHLGGALGGADDDLMAAYSRYGLALGEAFQLRDDVLGVFGSPEQTGKPTGDDLRCGKQTVLVAHTVADADPVQARHFLNLLGSAAIDDDAMSWMQELIVDSGALDEVETAIARRTREALDALHTVPTPAADALRELAVAATQRHS
ncbi:MAG: polyprenyl synthetase family protein [Actinomycetales bacterium]|nr:polyprenyl synthetase family protein [Actinomycetales bacterium]